MRPVEDVLGLLDRGAAVDDLLVVVVVAEADNADVLHVLENVDDHLVVVEKGLHLAEVLLLLCKCVGRVKHLRCLELQQLRIVDRDMALVAHGLVVVLSLGFHLWLLHRDSVTWLDSVGNARRVPLPNGTGSGSM